MGSFAARHRGFLPGRVSVFCVSILDRPRRTVEGKSAGPHQHGREMIPNLPYCSVPLSVLHDEGLFSPSWCTCLASNAGEYLAFGPDFSRGKISRNAHSMRLTASEINRTD